MFYIYVLKLKKNNEFYIGYTEDLTQRLKQHQRIEPSTLIYYEAYQTKKLARERERKLKYHSSAWRGLKKRIIA